MTASNSKKEKSSNKKSENEDVEMQEASTSKADEPKSQQEIDLLSVEGWFMCLLTSTKKVMFLFV